MIDASTRRDIETREETAAAAAAAPPQAEPATALVAAARAAAAEVLRNSSSCVGPGRQFILVSRKAKRAMFFFCRGFRGRTPFAIADGVGLISREAFFLIDCSGPTWDTQRSSF
jgi:hypothetical protein